MAKLSIYQMVAIDPNMLDLYSMAEKKELLRQVAQRTNQRLTALENANVESWSPAYRAMGKSGGKLSSKQKTEKDIDAEIQRGVEFLRHSTSKISNVRIIKANEEQLLGQSLTNDQNDLIWKMYDKYGEKFQSFFNIGYKDALKIFSQMVQDNPRKKEKGLTNIVESFLNEYYVEIAKGDVSSDAVFEYFKVY